MFVTQIQNVIGGKGCIGKCQWQHRTTRINGKKNTINGRNNLTL